MPHLATCRGRLHHEELELNVSTTTASAQHLINAAAGVSLDCVWRDGGAPLHVYREGMNMDDGELSAQAMLSLDARRAPIRT